ncbi:uncharacterized protein LOC124926551 [Impatiens glandulifera]|uniref:uncharacterized protein LOC124926551 n=1 Tax=Impatiens glandulifera TaxID=253017 RepID=UPI001FB173AA|nr:uncharacterized protein LOC124926551 [Impatiens glandulifera]
MGKVSTTEVKTKTKTKKKKGRPSLLDLQKRALQQDNLHRQTLISSKPNFNTPTHRSATRNPNSDEIDAGRTGGDDDDDDDDDDERKEKKVKLVGRFLPSSNHQHCINSLSHNSASVGHESSADEDNHEMSIKKQKINAGGGRSRTLHASAQDKKFQKATVAVHGNSLNPGPTTPLPDKKLLIFIIDRLRKKDTYGVFSEPVDPNELPDYHEIIENPMDFGTLRNKLEDGIYTKFEEFEADVFLICANAMQYNASDTVYFRQAKTIQELAKRDFDNLKEVNEEGEPQPKVVRRGRPPTKNLKKEFSSPPSLARCGPESSSDATPNTGGENQNASGSNNYNLRKGPMSYKFRPNDVYVGPSHLSGGNEVYHDWASDWNTEFPASVLKAEAKHVKKTFMLDENKRSTYKLSQASTLGDDPYMLTSLNGQTNRLMGVGVHVEHGYSRSLARFAANLGPLAWKIASKKIESVLPSGVKFGPGWVGEKEESSQQTPPILSEQQKSPINSLFDAQPHLAIPNSGLNTNELSYGGEFIHQQEKPSDCNGHNPSSFQKYQQNSIERQYSLPVAAPDLNTGSSSSSKQQPDLALQL